MLRKILAVIVGIATALILFFLTENMNRAIFPLPVHIDPANHTAMSQYIRHLPFNALLVLLGGWVFGSFCCGFIIRVISASADKIPAYIAGLFLTLSALVDLFIYPHPMWFSIIGAAVFIPFTLLGHLTTLKKKFA